MTSVDTAASLSVAGRPEDTPLARRFARGVLTGWGRDDLTADVELVVAELVTNAVLHTGGPARLTLREVGTGVRVEVSDPSPDSPLQPRGDAGGTTGRGLALVRASTSALGVDVDAAGKTVWCVVTGEVAVPDGDPLDLWPDVWPDEEPADPQTVTVDVGEAPTGLLLAAKEHLGDLVRELSLAEAGSASVHGIPADLVHSILEDARAFQGIRRQIRRQCEAAHDRGEPRVRLSLVVPTDIAPTAERYLAALHAADAVARDARLLALESPTEYRVVREWYVEGLVAGLGDPEHRGRRTFESRLIDELHALERRARTAELAARLQRVTAELAVAESPGRIAELVLAEGQRVIGAAGGLLCLVDERAPSEHWLQPIGAVGSDAGVRSDPGEVCGGPTHDAARTGSAVWVESRGEHPELFVGDLDADAQAVAALPLLLGGRVLGVMRFAFSTPRIFEGPERSFFESLAVQTGQALGRSLALATARRLQDELDRLLHSGSVTAPEEARRAAGVDLAVLRTLYDTAPVALTVVDTAGHFLRVNHVIEAETGLSGPEHVGRRLEEVYRGHWGVGLRAQLEEVLAADVSVDGVELELPSHQGVPKIWRSSWVPVRDAAGVVEAVVVVAADVTKERQAVALRGAAEERTALLAHVGEVLAAVTSVDEVVDLVGSALVPRWGSWVVVHMLGADARIRHLYTRHREKSATDRLRQLFASFEVTTEQPFGAGWVIGHGLPQEVPAVDEDLLRAVSSGDEEFVEVLTRVGVGSAMIVPLVARGRTLGALSVGREDETVLDPADIALLEDLGRRVGLALDNARSLADSVRLDLALSATGQGSYEWNVATGELVWDDRLLGLLGLERSGFDGRLETFFDVVHPEDRSWVQAALTDATATGSDLDLEYRVRRPSDGVVCRIRARGRGITGRDGRAERFLGTATDVTALREESDRVLRTLEQSGDGFLSLGPDGRVDYLNREAERILDRPRGDLLGRSLLEAFPLLAGSELLAATVAATGEHRAAHLEGFVPAFGRYLEIRVHPGEDGPALYLSDTGEARTTRDERDRAHARLDLIDQVGTRLAAAFDAEAGLEALCEVLVGSLCDVVLLDLAEPGQHPRALVRAREPEIAAAFAKAEELGPRRDNPASVVQDVLRGGPAVLFDDARAALEHVAVSAEQRALWTGTDVSSGMIVPLAARGRVLGCLTMARTGDQDRAYDDADLVLAAEVARRAALMIDNALQFATQRQVAETLQRSLLPELPVLPGIVTAAAYEPSSGHASVGGDWYDVFSLPGRGVGLVVGDVMGHDIAAAAAMGQLRSVLRSVAADGERPAVVLRRLDELVDAFAMADLATVVYARLELEEGGGGTLSYANAGHPPPLLLLPDGTSRYLVDGHSPMVGAPSVGPREQADEQIPAGSALLMFTDGLVERRGVDLDDALEELRQRAVALWAHRPGLNQLCEELMAAAHSQTAGDDAAVLAVHLPG